MIFIEIDSGNQNYICIKYLIYNKNAQYEQIIAVRSGKELVME